VLAVKNDVTIDRDRKLVIWRGKSCRLTGRQFAMVAYLAAHPGFVRDRGQIIAQQDAGWPEVQDDAVTSTVKRIRAAFRRDLGVDPIGTMRDGGYYWKETLE
jgi:two-component system, OmpR family, response regulator